MMEYFTILFNHGLYEHRQILALNMIAPGSHEYLSPFKSGQQQNDSMINVISLLANMYGMNINVCLFTILVNDYCQ